MCPDRRWAWDAGPEHLSACRGYSPLSLTGPSGKRVQTLGTGSHGPSPACSGHSTADALIVASWVGCQGQSSVVYGLAIVCFHSRPFNR